METDKITLADLSIFDENEESSIFTKLDFTRTTKGKFQLKKNLTTPLNNKQQITDVQDTLKYILLLAGNWPLSITNGTLMVIEQFYETPLNTIRAHSSKLDSISYKLLHAADFSLIRYSVEHLFTFIKGFRLLIELLSTDNSPLLLKKQLDRISELTDIPSFKIVHENTDKNLSPQQVINLAHFILYKYKNQVGELLRIYAQLDAWYSMAKAAHENDLFFPEFIDIPDPFIEVKGLFHLLLRKPVSNDLSLDADHNFLLLTGANMAGKSTFIKSMGVAVYLAHLGMAVPATSFKISPFDGLISNINVTDSIVKGESYFFNEIQRIKTTISRINNKKKWIVLIDELFKGTNIQDAMNCSTAVIEGLQKVHNALFIVSTHLYEISERLKTFENISFYYFETTVENEEMKFNYTLKQGISNDRLGYLLLKQEGVVEMLSKL